jgi:hypothetical protein
MKAEASLLSSPSFSQFYLRFMPARLRSTVPLPGVSTPSSKSATQTSRKSAATAKAKAKARPSFYLAASCLALGVSGYLFLPGEEANVENLNALLAKGWVFADSSACPRLEQGIFFEIDSDQGGNIEGFLTSSGRWLISAPALPQAPYSCRKIKAPSFIQEIL